MLSDYTISRAVGAHFPDQVKWSKDGGVFLLFKKDLIMLKTKKTNEADVTELGELFTPFQFSGTFMNWENYLMSVLCDDEIIRMGQAKRHIQGQQNDSSLTELACSESGISSSGGIMITLVTDSLNGYLVTETHGDLQLVCSLNKLIAELDGDMDIRNVLRADQLARLRIHTMGWANKLDFDRIGTPIWPIVSESLFVLFTESSTTWFYRINEEKDLPERVFSFETGLTVSHDDDEYVRKCKISEWMKGNSKSAVVSYLLMITSKNRVLIRKLMFNLKDKQVGMVSEFDEVLDVVPGIISTGEFKKIGDQTVVLSILSTACLQFVVLSPQGIVEKFESDLLGTQVQCTSLVQFVSNREEDSHLIFHTLVANSYRDLVHLKIDLPSSRSFANSGPILSKRYNYRQPLDVSDEERLPLFNKLKLLGKTSNFRILSLTSDPTGKFLGLLTSLHDPEQPIDGRIISHREDLSFSVIPVLDSDNSFDILLDSAVFNSVQSAPILRLQSYQFLRSVLPDVEKTFDLGEDTGTARQVVFEKDMDPVSCLQQNLILSSLSEKVRLTNTFNPSSINRSNLERLAKIVVELVRTGKLDLSSGYDQLMCQQYLRLLGLGAPNGFWGKYESRKEVTIPISGLDGIVETFPLGSIGPTTDCITSNEGHTWKVCDLTLLPLLNPKVKQCSYCESRILCKPNPQFSYGNVTDLVLDSLKICIFCGGRHDVR
ncbi:DEKNAAC102964 [Brettanomyces naardenensis]|uniref:DEKNAAC102964 n=1 Tax=Brettanomyces naardenensis TaxID=13370 RepID=A0A448YM18_BRENA|nr:DEKNAAC102964 [Brettanomyces naardenensis]